MMNIAFLGATRGVVTVDEALRARNKFYFCVKCLTLVIPHAGARPHFVHYRLSKECKK